MSDLRKAAAQALDALEAMMAEFKALDLPYGSKAYALAKDARLDLRAALAEPTVPSDCPYSHQPNPEPVAWRAVGGSIWGHKGGEDDVPLYEHPPQRQPLTEEEIESHFDIFITGGLKGFARAIERAHGIASKDE